MCDKKQDTEIAVTQTYMVKRHSSDIHTHINTFIYDVNYLDGQFVLSQQTRNEITTQLLRQTVALT